MEDAGPMRNRERRSIIIQNETMWIRKREKEHHYTKWADIKKIDRYID